jgi:dUTP pyrophosphatase
VPSLWLLGYYYRYCYRFFGVPHVLSVSVCRLSHGFNLPLPECATLNSAGMDLRAAIPEQEVWILAPHDRLLVPTGIIVAIPEGYEGQVRPRSGLSFKHGVTVLNAPGTIDSDYRGELKVLLINHSAEPFKLKRGERIAQLLIAQTTRWFWSEEETISSLGSTQRGDGGYGSTGLS